jgi:hypothetical protein
MPHFTSQPCNRFISAQSRSSSATALDFAALAFFGPAHLLCLCSSAFFGLWVSSSRNSQVEHWLRVAKTCCLKVSPVPKGGAHCARHFAGGELCGLFFLQHPEVVIALVIVFNCKWHVGSKLLMMMFGFSPVLLG